jgi:hypothetical protein
MRKRHQQRREIWFPCNETFCPLNVSLSTRIETLNAASTSWKSERSGSGDHFLVGFTLVVRTHLNSHFSIKPP